MAMASHPVMEQQQLPNNNAKTPVKANPLMMVIGVILTLGLGFLLMWLGWFNECCGLGYLLVAVVALYIPKMFGLTKTQYLVVFGVVFFVFITAIGAFVISKPMFEKDSDYASYNDGGFSNLNIVVDTNGDLDVTVTFSGTADTIKFDLDQVQLVSYQMIRKTTSDEYKYTMTSAGSGVYTVHISKDRVPANFVYQYRFEKVTGEQTDVTKSSYYLGVTNDSEITKFCLIYNAYTAGIIIVLFYLMMILTAVSRRNLEKTRARMEAEGRLYPQGYGRCKECGSIVLPGETCCRKCGAYIDVPDELRHKKVDMVQCSECGAEIPEDATVCPKCGAKFDEDEEIVYVDSESDEKMQCSDCGSVIPADATVCPKCGAKFDEDDGTADTEEKKD